MDLNKFKGIVHEEAIDRLDHSNLNNYFEVPNAENIAIWV